MAESIHYMRHGKTEDLTLGVRSRTTTPLTEEGRGEAETAANTIVAEGLTFDEIIRSPLPRAQQTAEIVAKRLGYPIDQIQILGDLQERRWGEAEGVLNSIVQERWPGGFDTVPGAETEAALLIRAETVYRRLLQRPGRLLVVGHGTLGRAIRDVAHGMAGQNDFNAESGKIPTAGVLQLHPRPQK